MDGTITKPLVEEQKKEDKVEKECACQCQPLYVLLFLCASVFGMCYSMYKFSVKQKLFSDGVTAKKIISFMCASLAQSTKLSAKGVLWRIFMFYTVFILYAIVGLLNCIPCVNRALNKKPRLPCCRNWRNVILGTFLWILVICWCFTIIYLDLHTMSIKKAPFTYLYRFSCFFLNLTWTLAITFCTRNTLFQQIYQQPFATIISTHRVFGTLSFWTTGFHIVVIILNWWTKNKAGFGKWLWHKIFHYAWSPYQWKDIHFLNLGFMIATDWLLKLLPVILLMFLAAMPIVRRKAWEVFYYLHVFVIITFLYLLVFHSRNIIYYAFIPICLYVIDKLMRWSSIYLHKCTGSVTTYDDVIVLEVERGGCCSTCGKTCCNCHMADLVGSVVYLNIPQASFFQYHPMSIAHNEGNHLVFYIKVTGHKNSWTHKVAALNGQKDIRVYVEGPYTMMKRKTTEPVEKKQKILVNEYNKNIVVVAGGCGFAGISSYLKDSLRLIKDLPAEEQAKYSVTVVLAVQYHSHLDGMKALLLECKKYDFAHVHLFTTYSHHPELLQKALQGKDANSVEVTSDVEEKQMLQFTVGRPDLDALLKDLPNEPISAFFCGPKPLCHSFLKALSAQQRPFSFHPDVFDM